jgi:hypothetical protein
MLKEDNRVSLELAESRQRIVNNSKETIMRRRRIILLISQGREPDFTHQVLRLGTEMPYKIQYR